MKKSDLKQPYSDKFSMQNLWNCNDVESISVSQKPKSVFSFDGKVVGIDGLRVVDASVMPQIASGNLNAPTIMIAERMSDLIKNKDPLPPANVPVYKPPQLETRR